MHLISGIRLHVSVFSKEANSVSPQSLKAIVTPQSLLVLDFRGSGLERWLVLDLTPQLASQSHSLPFEFRALEAILQYKVRQSRETLCITVLSVYLSKRR